jgi:hypothetical protein
VSIDDLRKAIPKARKSLPAKHPTFFVAPSARDAEPQRVALSGDMQSELIAIAVTMLQRAAEYEQVDYDPDARIERGEQVLLISSANVDDGGIIYDIVDRLHNLKYLDARTLIDTPTTSYGIGFGTTADERILFVRRKRLDSITAGGKLFAIAGDMLRPVKEPGLVIDRTFDLIVFPEGVVAFDHQAFEKLVRDPADVSAELRKNAQAVAKIIPFAPGLIDALVARGEGNRPMIRRKLRSIVEVKHLDGVTIAEVRAALKAQGKSPTHYIKKDKMDFAMADALFVLRFLDEGTWRGWRSKTLYAAGGRSVVK